MFVCALAGAERTLWRRIEFPCPEMPATHTRRRSDTETSKNMGMQTLPNVTQALTDTQVHTLEQEIRRKSGHTRRQISRFHTGHCHALILTAQDYKVTYRRVHAGRCFEH